MDYTVILLESVTMGIKARRVLRSSGIASRVIKIDPLRTMGCSYGIEISNDDYFKAISILQMSEIAYRIL